MTYEDHDTVVGKIARVTIAIPGGNTPGEVLVRVRGGSESYIAYSLEAVDRGIEVVVLADRGARSVDVAPL
ncbi:MAG TPA: hypothetical protein VED59_00470 [Acidimicrobiales bacterium]|nr:hypothetical protein [Acidimicrobiales bacterium]